MLGILNLIGNFMLHVSNNKCSLKNSIVILKLFTFSKLSFEIGDKIWRNCSCIEINHNKVDELIHFFRTFRCSFKYLMEQINWNIFFVSEFLD